MAASTSARAITSEAVTQFLCHANDIESYLDSIHRTQPNPDAGCLAKCFPGPKFHPDRAQERDEVRWLSAVCHWWPCSPRDSGGMKLLGIGMA